MINIDPLTEKVRRTLRRHELSPGTYARYLWQNEKGTRKMGVNEYGCADAANLLYIIGDFPTDPDLRSRWVSAMQAMQDPETGLFYEGTHHTLHTTAHVTAALELFDARPLYPLTALEPYKQEQALYGLLEGLDWIHSPWPEAHKGAGLYAALVITRSADLGWQDRYFAWLTEKCSSETGIGRGGDPGSDSLAHHLYGWFHYLFNFEHARRPFPYPEQLIDSCIRIYRTMDDPLFAARCNFKEMDLVYSLNRASRQTPHRFAEVREVLMDLTPRYLDYLLSVDDETDDNFNDLHMLFGALCAVAELQQALPGELVSTVPLKGVLDRRPFI